MTIKLVCHHGNPIHALNIDQRHTAGGVWIGATLRLCHKCANEIAAGACVNITLPIQGLDPRQQEAPRPQPSTVTDP